jgi:hypothetical protein
MLDFFIFLLLRCMKLWCCLENFCEKDFNFDIWPCLYYISPPADGHNSYIPTGAKAQEVLQPALYGNCNLCSGLGTVIRKIAVVIRSN